MYYKYDEDEDLDGMVSMHMDDFNLAGPESFITMVTGRISAALDVSKVEDKSLRFGIGWKY